MDMNVPEVDPPYGVDWATDQALRLREFARDHPEWFIGWDGQADEWHARKILRDSSEEHRCKHLRDLLDLLEALVNTSELPVRTPLASGHAPVSAGTE